MSGYYEHNTQMYAASEFLNSCQDVENRQIFLGDYAEKWWYFTAMYNPHLSCEDLPFNSWYKKPYLFKITRRLSQTTQSVQANIPTKNSHTDSPFQDLKADSWKY